MMSHMARVIVSSLMIAASCAVGSAAPSSSLLLAGSGASGPRDGSGGAHLVARAVKPLRTVDASSELWSTPVSTSAMSLASQIPVEFLPILGPPAVFVNDIIDFSKEALRLKGGKANVKKVQGKSGVFKAKETVKKQKPAVQKPAVVPRKKPEIKKQEGAGLQVQSILALAKVALQTGSRLFITKSIGLGIAYYLINGHNATRVFNLSESVTGFWGGVKSTLSKGFKVEGGKEGLPNIAHREEDAMDAQAAAERDAARLATASAYNSAFVHTINPGDHIMYKGAFGMSSMSHHAIYVGDGNIVHFTGGAGTDTSLAAKKAARITLEKVTAIVDLANSAHACLEVVSPTVGAASPEEIVARAMSKVGTGGYHLLMSNCEHFAHWCKTGESISAQVASALQGPARFVQQLADDIVEVSKHPIKGKEMRNLAGTIRAALTIAAAHLLVVSW